MSILTRKQREIQDREKQILSHARRILLDEGYQALSMDRLAGELEYAKGTLYNHFPNKEEIVVALAIESLDLRRQLMEKASMLSSKSRMKLLAIGCACELYATHFSEHFAVEQMIRNSTILNKSTEKRREVVRGFELRCMGVVSAIVRDAIAAKDLELPELISPEELVFGFWSLSYGSHVLAASSPSLKEIGIPDPQHSIRYHGWTLMNGYQWQPILSIEETHQCMDDMSRRILSDE